ncbi:2-amino-4-hydroxy-6-hydroxymethyldihydropteridine diphosphokinase [Marchantia polymorpha subsp. ruderalis]|uniref:Pterin-binding domain-containing protein n=1 Tax=Marchantia polymorpha TaxID=3197 RepID=A0A2R6XDP9_MARPO|nr:hypothetical protein MARPO_0021s0079 [Marchantia polymorpha]BBN01296.1 hypothetical protein Mp_2g06240 [Marchantia polymorpha subsp. ruderalis]|eukprot:PTQ44222.1 hypothetical protein MARPO_0021s0079 [Marchantia polymorpha]
MWKAGALARAFLSRPRASLSSRWSATSNPDAIVGVSRQGLATFTSDSSTEEDHSHANVVSISPQAEEEVVIAIGGNVGDRVQNFNRALEMLRTAGIRVTGHASLYESAAAYITDQPSFLNSAVKARTRLDPHSLLRELKRIESELGRIQGGVRYGPRPIDLDILYYGAITVTTESLEIPHPRIAERPFVLAPLVDLLDPETVEVSPGSWTKHPSVEGGAIQNAWKGTFGGETCVGKEGLKRVLPLGRTLWDWSQRTHVMGILNITPDSFSDGGSFLGVDSAVEQVRKMVSEGADFIDLGAQSTRPGARRLTTEEEMDRLLPVLDALAKSPGLDGVCLSVDTFDSRVAAEAVSRGVHIVNDVSGGTLDPAMWNTVAKLGVPYICMHMRGDPLTMQNKLNTQYSNVCSDVAAELASSIKLAELAGIPSWRLITDPGLGFAKTVEQNVELIRHLPAFREQLSWRNKAASNAPLLMGPSRKGFLGKLCGIPKAEDRDFATAAAVAIAISGGANIIRAHNDPLTESDSMDNSCKPLAAQGRSRQDLGTRGMDMTSTLPSPETDIRSLSEETVQGYILPSQCPGKSNRRAVFIFPNPEFLVLLDDMPHGRSHLIFPTALTHLLLSFSLYPRGTCGTVELAYETPRGRNLFELDERVDTGTHDKVNVSTGDGSCPDRHVKALDGRS